MKIILSLFTFCLLVLVSCQKEISVESGNSPSIDSAMQFNSIIALDTTKAAPFDTTYKLFATYDGQKRITATMMVEYNNTGAIVDTFWIEKLLYSGNDTLPFKSTTMLDEGTVRLDTAYFAYAATGKLLYDSTNSKQMNPPQPDIETSVFRYTHFANRIAVDEKSYINQTLNHQANYTIWATWQNGNIVTQQDTTTTNDVETFNVSYDTKPNPLYALRPNSPFVTYGSDFLLFDTKNNVAEINNTLQYPSSGGTSEHYKYFYTYNTQGYPAIARIQTLASNRTLIINKIMYYYSK